ncbi:MAG: alanine racemase [Luteitalea sp.]|nr:alanine racemase [Luteitalea sp.]
MEVAIAVRHTVARVHLPALQANYRTITELTIEAARASQRQPPQIIAVVKANAYGHGATRVAGALEAAGASMLACADIEEGIELRRDAIRVPILIFGALGISDLDGVFAYRLTPTISTPTAAQNLARAAAARGERLHCQLKIDTGMNRLGFRHDNLRRTLPAIAQSRHLAIDAVYTHFATADDPESGDFVCQRERFEAARRLVAEVGLHPAKAHAANSAALLRDEQVWYDAVRPGLLLYGVVPPPLATTLEIAPVLSLTSRIVAVKGLRPGEGVGYGLRYRPERPSTIAVVPAGYADGLDARLAGRASVLVRGRRVPIVGAVSMDMITIDVTALDVAPGDEVVILGRQGAERIDVREMAAAVGAAPYELLCRLGSRIDRVYL